MTAERDAAEAALRPTRLADISGQVDAVAALTRAVAGAKERGELPSHVLLVGPAGTGKTTLAGAIATEVGAALTILYGVNLRQRRDLEPTLEKLVDWKLAMSRTRRSRASVGAASGNGGSVRRKKGAVLMVDEIHRMWAPVQELLFPVMEDGILDTGDGIRLPMAPLMVIGATTDPERLLVPLLDRFPLVVRLVEYSIAELAEIAQKAAKALGCSLDPDAATVLAGFAQGIPRVVIKLVRAARDYGDHVDAGVAGRLLADPALLWRLDGRSAGGAVGTAAARAAR